MLLGMGGGNGDSVAVDAWRSVSDGDRNAASRRTDSKLVTASLEVSLAETRCGLCTELSKEGL